jgi:hypothetical protein
MAPDDRQNPDPSEAGSTGGEPTPSSTEDALRALEERLGRASEAAERLLAEAARSAASRVAAAADRAAEPTPSETPPAGWETPRDRARPAGKAPGEAELDALLGIVRSFRDLIPADLERRLTEALRELLLAVRALIDWCLERIEQRRSDPVQVQDIPIL